MHKDGIPNEGFTYKKIEALRTVKICEASICDLCLRCLSKVCMKFATFSQRTSPPGTDQLKAAAPLKLRSPPTNFRSAKNAALL